MAVSPDPLSADDGIKVSPAPAARTSSDRPTTLARPQSTTNVSRNFPIITLAGFRSRWITRPAMSVRDGLTHLEKRLEKPAEGDRRWRTGVVRGDLLCKGLALDEAHGVCGRTVAREEPVHGDYPRMLKS